MSAATRPVEALPVEQADGERSLLALQVTTHSTLGTIAYRTGGLLIDHGWIRILGAGHPRVGGGLREWNAALGGQPLEPPLERALIVAYDALGGFFALNSGLWPEGPTIRYFAPDTLEWEPTNAGYTEFVAATMTDWLDGFYADRRWAGWESEIEALGPDEAISIAAPLVFTGNADGRTPIGERSRRGVPARELWALGNLLGEQLAGVKDGQQVRLRIT